MTGPVAGLIAQHVHVNGFTESGVTGVTALSFGSQKRDSCVTQLGWRLTGDFGKLRPFAEADWNHECGPRDNTVTASLTTIVAPSYTLDAAPTACEFAASLGASTSSTLASSSAP